MTLTADSTWTDLEAYFHADDTKCQANHWAEMTCSVEVTHRSWNCGNGGKLICLSAAQYNLECILDPYSDCEGCGRPCSDCWRIVPV